MGKDDAGDTQDGRRRSAAIVARGVLYALAIALLVIFGPAKDHVFIYQGF